MFYILTIFIYLIFLTIIGLKKYNNINSQKDFALAGRNLTSPVLLGTMLATWIGTGSILGNAGKAYEIGISAVILPLGGVLGIYVLSKIATKVRSYNKITVPEIIGSKYGEFAQILTLIALIMSYMVIVSYQFNAGGIVLNMIFTNEKGISLISIESATIITASFIIIYTMLAGLLSVALTDFVNGIIMTIVLIISLPILWFKIGGFSNIEIAFLNLGKIENFKFLGNISNWDIINYCLPSFLLVLGDANMYQRFSASKNIKGLKKATNLLIIAVFLIEILIILIAWVGSTMISEPESGRYIMVYISHRILPPLIGSIMLTSIVGIIISTADSYLLVPANAIVNDVYLKYFFKNPTDKKVVFFSRITVLIFGIIAFFISTLFAKSTSIFEKALYAYTIYGVSITPSLLAAFFWKKATKEGVISSITSGALTILLWKNEKIILSFLPEKIYYNIDEVIPGIIISTSSLILISLICRKK